MQRLAAFLQIRSGEARLVGLVAALFALIEAGRGLGGNTADALFFTNFGVEFLPYMFMLLGAANFMVSLTYAASLGKFDKHRFFVLLLIVLAIVLLLERAALIANLSALYPILWITVNIISSIVGLLCWNIAGEVCDARQAKRLFSLFVSAGILGGVIGNFITGPLAQILGTPNVLIVYALLLFSSAICARAIIRRFFKPATRRGHSTSFITEVRAGFDYVRGSTMFILMAIGSVLFSILYFSISYPFNIAVSAAFPSEAEIAGFLGLFSGIATALTFVVSLFVANRWYARFGVVNAVLLLPVTYLIGFVLFALNFSLTSAVIARMSQLIVLGGIAGTAYSTFFNVVPSDKRGQVRSFDSGVPEQIGVALSGVLLILGQRVLTPTQIFVMGMLGSLACGALVWRLKRSYGAALLAALRAGRYEVFASPDRALASFHGDANALRVVTQALRDPKPTTRRIAIELLARLQVHTVIPAIIDLLHDPDREVRLAALRALGDFSASEAASELLRLLNDDDASIRALAVHVLPQVFPPITRPLIEKLDRLLADGDQDVQRQAALALLKFKQLDRALPTLDRLLHDSDPATRARTIEALGEVRSGFDLTTISAALHDQAIRVRRAACHALAQLHDEQAIAPLIERLSDVEASVRKAAARALQSFGPAATIPLLQVLSSNNVTTQAAALEALSVDRAAEPALHVYAQREIDRLRNVRAIAAALPDAGRSTRLLREALTANAAGCEQRLVKTIGLLGKRDAMDQVSKGLRARTAESRAAAVEALETLGDKQLARQIIPLLEETPDGDHQAAGEALRELIESDDTWLRALAARAIPELKATELIPHLHTLLHDPEAFTQAAAHDALIEMGEREPMETLQTMTAMERVLLLHEVPLFAALSPDDLKQIADIAREQWYADGSYLCHEGEESHEMYVLAAGQVRVTKGAGETEKYLATRYAGDFIGEMAIIEALPRSATVRADGEVRTLVIDGEPFKTILLDRPEVALALLRSAHRRLREKE